MKKQKAILFTLFIVIFLLSLIFVIARKNSITSDNVSIKESKALAINGEVVSEEINKLLYPNKTLNITAFTDTTTVQTYEIPKSGWLYISGYRTTSSYSAFFYRNDMLILHIWGPPNASIGASSVNSIYIPVKKGDIIKKEQAYNNYTYTVNLYYYE